MKEHPSNYSKQDHADLLKEKVLNKKERDWVKDTSSATVAGSDDRSTVRIKEWCMAVADYVFLEEKDTDEYKMVVKYCVKKEYLSELKSQTVI